MKQYHIYQNDKYLDEVFSSDREIEVLVNYLENNGYGDELEMVEKQEDGSYQTDVNGIVFRIVRVDS